MLDRVVRVLYGLRTVLAIGVVGTVLTDFHAFDQLAGQLPLAWERYAHHAGVVADFVPIVSSILIGSRLISESATARFAETIGWGLLYSVHPLLSHAGWVVRLPELVHQAHTAVSLVFREKEQPSIQGEFNRNERGVTFQVRRIRSPTGEGSPLNSGFDDPNQPEE